MQYAVKIIDTTKFAFSPGLTAKELLQEADMLSSLHHPRIIIKIIDT